MLQGKTIRVYLNIDPEKYIGTKYNIKDNSKVKSHENAPSLMIVKGPRQLAHTLELIDEYMKDNGTMLNTNYQKQSFIVEKISIEKLMEMGLIKTQNAEFTESDQ